MNSLQLLSLINVMFVVLITIVLLKRKDADSFFSLIPRWSIISTILITIGTSVLALFVFQISESSITKTGFMSQVPEQGSGAPDAIDVNKYDTWKYRVDAHSPAQYNDLEELKYWQSSVCGVCALTGVLNFYGQSVSLHDMVLLGRKEKVLSKEEGLASDGLKKLAALEGFSCNQLIAPSLDEIITFATAGHPVITLFPEEKYPGGHFIVITGGDKDNLFVADSSRWNRKIITKKWFFREWDGHSAWLVRPNSPHQRQPSQVLSDKAVPVRYDLSFEIDLKRSRFKCSEIIELDEKAPMAKLQLDSVGLSIESCYLSEGRRQSTVHITDDYELRDGSLIISAKHEIPVGRHFLHINFSDTFSNTLDGFYVSHYKGANGEDEKIIGALLEPTSARKMFPCFDDPTLKATYKLEVMLDDDLTAISNSPVDSQGQLPDSHLKRVIFALSPKMSTYLLQLVIGHLEATPAVCANGVSVKVWTKRHCANSGIFARDNAAEILGYYTDYFGSRSKWIKLDLIAMPNYEDGAMESPGAMTFGAKTILLDQTYDHDGIGKQPGILQYLTHELSHLWFGDSVTPKSWNDLWLSESFATWMSVKATAHLHPHWHFENELLKWRSHIMEIDALPSAPALKQAVLESSFLSSNYSLLVYSKGASIVAMLEKAMGEQKFCQGIRRYIATFADSNASTSDFCEAVSASSKFSVAAFVNNWISTPGFPLLWLSQNEASRLSCEQHRFLAIAHSNLFAAHDNFEYQLPTKLDFTTTENLSRSLERAQLGYSYCRFGFNSSLRRKLFPQIESLSTAEKFTLISDSFALMMAGKIDPSEYFAVMKALRQKATDISSTNAQPMLLTDCDPVLELECKQFAMLSSLIEDESTKKQLANFVTAQLRPSLTIINSYQLNGNVENQNAHNIRSKVYLTLGIYGCDQDILIDARKQLDKVLSSNNCKMPTGMLEAICSVVAVNGAAKDYESLARLYSKNSKNEVSTALLKGLSEFPQTSVITNLIEESLKGVEKGDAINILNDELTNPVNQKVAFSLLKTNWAAAQSNLGDPQTSYLLWEMSKSCRFDLNRELKCFIDKNAFLNQKLDRQMVNERLSARESFHNSVYEKFKDALSQSVQ